MAGHRGGRRGIAAGLGGVVVALALAGGAWAAATDKAGFAFTSAQLAAGQDLGLLHFLERPGKEPVAVTARRDGLLICRRPLAQARRGDCLGIVAWDYPAET